MAVEPATLEGDMIHGNYYYMDNVYSYGYIRKQDITSLVFSGLNLMQATSDYIIDLNNIRTEAITMAFTQVRWDW